MALKYCGAVASWFVRPSDGRHGASADDPACQRRRDHERRVIRVLFAVLVAVTLLTSYVSGAEGADEVYLRGSAGPYRGRVIDAKTKAPIAGAIVVAVWYEDVSALVPMNTRFYDAVEVVSDSQGYFVVDAPDIERRAPHRTRFPWLTIFKPEYTYYTGWLASATDQFRRQKKSLLGTVELISISHLNKKNQLRQLPSGLPTADVPREKYPRFMKALNDQREILSR